MIHTVDPVGGDAKVDEVLRQALAIISAHNATLNGANRQQVAEPIREQGHGWIFRLSHLLWTLFLTAMMVMLFNAGQSANRDLSNKLEELARIIEASSRNQAQRFPPSLDSRSVGQVWSSPCSRHHRRHRRLLRRQSITDLILSRRMESSTTLLCHQRTRQVHSERMTKRILSSVKSLHGVSKFALVDQKT